MFNPVVLVLVAFVSFVLGILSGTVWFYLSGLALALWAADFLRWVFSR
jgi:flagellar biosynthesis component FlhA